MIVSTTTIGRNLTGAAPANSSATVNTSSSTQNVISQLPTFAAGSIQRGKKTFRIRFPLPLSVVIDPMTQLLWYVHGSMPQTRKKAYTLIPDGSPVGGT